MKSFFKLVFALLTSFVILISLLAFFVFYFFQNSEKIKEKPISKDKRILEISLDQPLYESDIEKTFSISSMQKDNALYFDDLIQSIRLAAKDKNYLGISLKISTPILGSDKLQILREELIDFKKSGKFVYAYQKNTSQKAYYINSVADSIYHHPLGKIEWKGLALEVIFFKDLAKQFGVGFDVVKYGSHKGAVEPFLRNDLSQENRSQIKSLLDDIWDEWLNSVSKSRKIEKDSLNLYATDLVGYVSQQALKARFVDIVCSEHDYEKFLRKKIGLREDEEIPYANLSDIVPTTTGMSLDSKNKIAVLYAYGQIMPGKEYAGIQSEVYVKTIRTLIKDNDIKAVVLRVNSPGGSADAADDIYEELLKLAAKKPLYVSVSDMAASGGYYIAAAADSIYASPQSVLGSIGVFGIVPNVSKIANKNGVYADVVSTNANSMNFSPISGLNPVAKKQMTIGVENIYQRFLSIVAKSRNLTMVQADSLGNGKVYSGSKSKQNGLIDGFADLESVIKKVALKANLKDFSIEKYPKVKYDFLSLFERELNISAKGLLLNLLPEKAKIFIKPTAEEGKDNYPEILMMSPYSIEYK